jgi:hypothetical protein
MTGLNNHQPLKFLHGNVNKMIAMKSGDLRQKIIEPSFDRKKELYSRFGDRLVLKQDYSEKLSNVADRVDKHAKHSQLDPTTDDKWGHDRYDGRSKAKKIRRNGERGSRERSSRERSNRDRRSGERRSGDRRREESRSEESRSEESDDNIEEEEVKTYNDVKLDQNKVLIRNLPTEITKSQVQAIFNRYLINSNNLDLTF